MRHQMLACLLVSGAALIASDVEAQELGGYYSGMALNGLVTNQVNIAQRSASRRITGARLGEPGSIYDANAQLHEGAKLSYASSPTRRRANLAQFVAKSRASDPQGAAAMQRLFAEGDFIAAMGQQLKPLGLRVDDVADAYAVYWVSAWQAAHGDTRTIERDTMQAAREQAARALAATPELGTASDAQKQEFAEALLVQAALIGAMQDEYKDDPKLMPQVSAAVRKGARASGLDLDAMTLTDNGFVPAEQVGAAKATGTSPVLLAAAGGAGLGAMFLLGRAFGRRG